MYRGLVFSVYLITHVASGRVYVGKGRSAKKRWNDHRQAALKNSKKRLHVALREFGEQAFHMHVVGEWASEHVAFEVERWYTRFYRSTDPERGFNMVDGGGGAAGWTRSPEHTAKLIAAARRRKGVKLTEDQKQRRNAARAGYVASAETRQRISEAGKGRKLSPEHRAKLVAACKGKPRSDEDRQKIREKHLGKKLSEEHRKKLSDAHLGKKLSDEQRRKIGDASRRAWREGRRR